MARTAIAGAVSDLDGAVLPAETDGVVADGHYFQNSGRTKLFVRNSGGSPYVVTVQVSRRVQGQTVTPVTKTIPAGETHVFGPYLPADFGTQVNVDVSNAALKLRVVN